MNKFHKRLCVLIFFVSVISAGVIYFTVDINTLSSLTQFNPLAIIAALISISFGLFLDGLRLVHLVNISNEKISFSQALHVVFGNYFLALLTPGFSGGAIARPRYQLVNQLAYLSQFLHYFFLYFPFD